MTDREIIDKCIEICGLKIDGVEASNEKAYYIDEQGHQICRVKDFNPKALKGENKDGETFL